MVQFTGLSYKRVQQLVKELDVLITQFRLFVASTCSISQSSSPHDKKDHIDIPEQICLLLGNAQCASKVRLCPIITMFSFTV